MIPCGRKPHERNIHRFAGRNGARDFGDGLVGAVYVEANMEAALIRGTVANIPYDSRQRDFFALCRLIRQDLNGLYNEIRADFLYGDQHHIFRHRPYIIFGDHMYLIGS